MRRFISRFCPSPLMQESALLVSAPPHIVPGDLQDICHMSKICNIHSAVSIHIDTSMDTDRDTDRDIYRDMSTNKDTAGTQTQTWARTKTGIKTKTQTWSWQTFSKDPYSAIVPVEWRTVQMTQDISEPRAPTASYTCSSPSYENNDLQILRRSYCHWDRFPNNVLAELQTSVWGKRKSSSRVTYVQQLEINFSYSIFLHEVLWKLKEPLTWEGTGKISNTSQCSTLWEVQYLSIGWLIDWLQISFSLFMYAHTYRLTILDH